MKITYILVGFLFMFSGCSTAIPKVTKYKISPDIKIVKEESSSCRSKSVKVSSAFTSTSLMSKDMSYVQGSSKVFEYSESAWLNNPNRSVSRELIKMLRETELFKSVQESKSRSKADLIIESTLEEFMQYYSNDLDESYAFVQINFSIIDSKTNEVISEKTISSKIKTETLNAQGGVEALNEALRDVLNNSAKWFSKVCK